MIHIPAITAHRFYQMWQQSDCSIRNATEDNPTGMPQRSLPVLWMTTYGGPTADPWRRPARMAFYNVQDEDAPLFKKLADEYTNQRQFSPTGSGAGTGIQHAFLGTGDDFLLEATAMANPAVAAVANRRSQSQKPG